MNGSAPTREKRPGNAADQLRSNIETARADSHHADWMSVVLSILGRPRSLRFSCPAASPRHHDVQIHPAAERGGRPG